MPEAKEREVEGLVALGDLDAEAEDSLARLEKWTVLLTAKHGESWDPGHGALYGG